MNAEKFNKDFDYYKSKLEKGLDEKSVTLMMLAYCMGYCELSNHVNEELGEVVDVDPVLDKISILGGLSKQYLTSNISRKLKQH
jgi:hypothetical protein